MAIYFISEGLERGEIGRVKLSGDRINKGSETKLSCGEASIKTRIETEGCQKHDD